jgi:nucleotide-binding universal stress UspA family protein
MFRKVLVGLDGSETSWHAFRAALALAAECGSELWTLSVEEHLPHMPGTIAEVQDEIHDEERRENTYFARIQDEAHQLAEEQGVVLHCRVTPGHAASRILEFARTGAFDLIVVGHRGHANPWHRLLGSTADHIVDHAPCSVLVERPTAQPVSRQ